jgi:hypothetical protein
MTNSFLSTIRRITTNSSQARLGPFGEMRPVRGRVRILAQHGPASWRYCHENVKCSGGHNDSNTSNPEKVSKNFDGEWPMGIPNPRDNS